MVVDDSMLARSIIMNGLSAHPRIEVVGYAINTLDARNKIPQLKPDVITMDVEMPGQSGTDFLKQYLPSNPIPVILVSSLNLKVFDALAVGAIDFVRKPDAQMHNDDFIRNLTQKVIMASFARVRVGSAGGAGEQPRPEQCHHRPGRIHRRHRGHSGGDEAAPRRHTAHGHRPAYAHRLHQNVRRTVEPPVRHGGAGGPERR